MKRIAVGLIAMLAAAGDYRIVDMKPDESRELAVLDSKVSAAEQALKDSRDALDKKRFAVCIAHGLPKKACDQWSHGGLYGSWVNSGSVVGIATSTTNILGYSSTCVGWDKDFKHLVVEK